MDRSRYTTEQEKEEGYARVNVAKVERFHFRHVSPHCLIEESQRFMEELATSLTSTSEPDNVIFAGDFNAASVVWLFYSHERRGLNNERLDGRKRLARGQRRIRTNFPKEKPTIAC